MEASCLLSTCLRLPIQGIDQIALTIDLLYCVVMWCSCKIRSVLDATTLEIVQLATVQYRELTSFLLVSYRATLLIMSILVSVWTGGLQQRLRWRGRKNPLTVYRRKGSGMSER